MLYDLMLKKTQEWSISDRCTVKPIFEHISRNKNLREAQIQALLVYLFLKIEGGNKPLYQLFSEGFFCRNEDLTSFNINQFARNVFESNTAARALFELSRTPLKGNGNGKKKQTTLFPDLEKYLVAHPQEIDYLSISKNLFYGVSYPDFLFSLPMGAGKTFLMAAIIYLDLYFALNEPDNKKFAHNFLILAPSGLKSSIIPSLKTIERFDPSWILPEPAASNIKRMIKFEVLDKPKSAKKSNKARNPNAHKISNYQPFDTLMGLVMVVNAEKVILDRLDLDQNGLLFEHTEDEKDRLANELRNIISKIPNLQIHIDEVHHAATNDIKLRQVVNKWSVNGSINSVLGFSGTPYLGTGETVKISDEIQLKFTQITNTVFYYPLTTAVKKFLKKPCVEQTSGLTSIQIIEKGVKDFLKTFGNTVYSNGSIAKLAVYCGDIERLEEEIYPYLIGTMRIKPEEILKYHKGNKKYKTTKEAETDFNSIDTPISKKKIILLVQIGKEGWDCRSLTGVILSQKGDCPTNMVLQTSCRCLRQVDKDSNETAVIWLNEENAKTLDKQLKEEQQTSIQELSSLGKDNDPVMIERFSRMDYLKLPKIDFYQLNVEYETILTEQEAEPEKTISQINPKNHFDTAVIEERGLSKDDLTKKDILVEIEGERADFDQWIFDIARGSMGDLSSNRLYQYEKSLLAIFIAITYEKADCRVFNNLFRHDEIKSRIRLAFHRHRELNVKTEIIPNNASLLVIEKLIPVEDHDKLYPSVSDTKDILQADKTGKDISVLQEEVEAAQRKMKEFIASQPNPDLFTMAGLDVGTTKIFSKAVVSKDKTFHYLPYNFIQSRFELKFLQEVMSLASFMDNGLEIYYNGEKHITEFCIVCYEKRNDRWRRVGRYTPDFLVINRKDSGIYKILIVETKGSGFADQPEFKARRYFMESEFLKINSNYSGNKKVIRR
ncbi:DEAD/DEAH box helicase family protein [bacterium]|nr:DEAD/DEAH box helicase family protein [bacterium]MBU1753969.1 DEAD/DEAH box helicase family protein [bacterium]